MDTIERRYLREADFPHASSSPPKGNDPLSGWKNWVVGLVLAVGAFLVVLMVWALNNNFGPYGMTARMERVLAQLEGKPVIRPETALVVMRVMGQPGYDCEQVACDHKLAARNSAVRARLSSLLAAGKTVPDGAQVAASSTQGYEISYARTSSTSVYEIRSAY